MIHLPKKKREITDLSIQRPRGQGNIGALYFLPAFHLTVKIKSNSEGMYLLRIIPEYRGIKFTKNIVSELNKVSVLAKRSLSLSIPRICEMVRGYEESDYDTWYEDSKPREVIADNHNTKWVLSEINKDPLIDGRLNDVYMGDRETNKTHFSERRSFRGIPKKFLGKWKDCSLHHPLESVMHKILQEKEELETVEYDPQFFLPFGFSYPNGIGCYLFSTEPLNWDEKEDEEIYDTFDARYLGIYSLTFVRDPESLLKKLRVIQKKESDRSERLLSLTEGNLHYDDDIAEDRTKYLLNLFCKFEKSRKGRE